MRFSIEEGLKKGWISPEEAKSMREKQPKPKDPEGAEQVSLVKMVRQRFPKEGALLIHIPNGGSRRNAFEGWRLREQGVRAGVSDLLLPVARGGYHGLWVEFKASAPYTARTTPAQLEWLELMNEQGYLAKLCIGLDEAFETIESYLASPNT